MNTRTTRHWVIAADAHRAILYACSPTPGGELHLDETSTLVNTHVDEHEHHRPVRLEPSQRRRGVGKAPVATVPHTGAPKHELEEEHRRFGRDVGHWLGGLAGSIGRDPVTVFAPTRMAAVLRDELAIARDPSPRAIVRDAELVNLTPAELADHAVVREALGHEARRARA